MQPDVYPPCTVLIVEDDAAIREALADLLEAEGYRAAVVAHGRATMEYPRSHDFPGLILLDLVMPVQNGWKFRAELQRDPALSAVPVVDLSGDPHNAREALALNASGHVSKPKDIPTLLQAVAGHCVCP